jgi:hypothetical protein
MKSDQPAIGRFEAQCISLLSTSRYASIDWTVATIHGMATWVGKLGLSYLVKAAQGEMEQNV